MREAYIAIRFPPSSAPKRYYLVANISGTPTIIGNFGIPNGGLAGSITVLTGVSGPFTVASAAGASTPGSIALYTQSHSEAALAYDPATTSIMGAPGTVINSI